MRRGPIAFFVAALVSAPHAVPTGLAERAAPEAPLACIPTRDELAQWGLPAGEETETTLVDARSTRTVHPADDATRALATVILARPSTTWEDARDAFDYDEERTEVCIATRKIDARFGEIALALALGAPAPRNLIDLSHERSVLVATATTIHHDVDVDERLIPSFLLLAGPDTSWRDLANITQTRHTFRLAMSAPDEADPAELFAFAKTELERELAEAPANATHETLTMT